jgi:hypothetical protein
MLALGFILAGAGAAVLLIGLFSHSGEFIGWNIGTHPALLIGAFATVAMLVGVRLIRYGAVRGLKNAWAQRKFEKRAREARED